MKRFLRMLAFATAALLLGACSQVPAGNVGVKVYLLGGAKGVDMEALGPGRYWIGINEQLFLFPTFTQNTVWTKDSRPGSPTDESFSFQTSEGLVVNADIGMSYAINPLKVPSIFQKYRRGIDEITDVYLRNMVRDALVEGSSSLKIESVYGAGKTDLMNATERSVREQVGELGIIVEKIYWIGELRLPPEVVTGINAKIAATQQALMRENEIQTATAAANIEIEKARGAARSITVVAEAQAEANRILAQSITDELIRYEAVKTWKGNMPQVLSGSEGNFLIQVLK